MTKLSLSLVLAAAIFALSGAILFALSTGRRPAAPPPRAALDEALEERIENQLKGLAERLERLETTLAAGDRSRLETTAGPAAARAGEAPEASEPPAGESPGDAGEQQLLASILRGDGPGALRNYVQDCIRDEREERRRRELAKFEEHQKEIAELNQGPYGKYNFRVNTLARKLGLSERQKEQYYALLADYAARFEEARKNVNREDPEDYKAYRERKQQMNDDFNTVVVQTLSPSQVEEYAKLPDFEKTPDPKGMGVESIQIALPSPEEGGPVGDAVFFTTTDVLGVEPPGAPEGGAVLQGGIKVEPPPATK